MRDGSLGFRNVSVGERRIVLETVNGVGLGTVGNFALWTAACVFLAGCGTSTPTATSTQTNKTNPLAAANVYVEMGTQAGAVYTMPTSQILTFSASSLAAGGTVYPTAQNWDPAESWYEGITTDGNGALYVAGSGSLGSLYLLIDYFLPALSANPISTVNPQLNGSSLELTPTIAVDGTRQVLYTPFGPTIYQYPTTIGQHNPNFSLKPAICATEAGAYPDAVYNVATDPSGDLYFQCANGAIYTYAAPVTSTSTAISSMDLQGLPGASIKSFATDSSGNLYVLVFENGAYSIQVYAPGNTTPIRNISGSTTLMNTPNCIWVDKAGIVYLTDTVKTDGDVEVLEYAPLANGNQAPTVILDVGVTSVNANAHVVAF